MKSSSLFLLLFTISLVANATAKVSLLSNGGFEDYAVSDSYIHLATDCQGAVSPCVEDSSTWQPLASSPNEFLGIKDNFSNIDAYDGSNYAELTPVTNAGITQSFEAQAGLAQLSWVDHGRYGINYEYQVLINGESVFNGVTSDFDAWTKKQFEVALLDGVNTLSFISLSSNNNMGANIDTISLTYVGQGAPVSAVPEADTSWLMLVGFGLFCLLSNKRARRV